MSGPQAESGAKAEGDELSPEEALAVAKLALRRGNGWDCDPSHYRRLRTDCEVLGVAAGDPAIGAALRRAITEVTEGQVRKRSDRAYSGEAQDAVLYDCRWQSAAFGRRMYLKFAVLSPVKIEVYTFHADTEK